MIRNDLLRLLSEIRLRIDKMIVGVVRRAFDVKIRGFWHIMYAGVIVASSGPLTESQPNELDINPGSVLIFSSSSCDDNRFLVVMAFGWEDNGIAILFMTIQQKTFICSGRVKCFGVLKLAASFFK